MPYREVISYAARYLLDIKSELAQAAFKILIIIPVAGLQAPHLA